MDESDLIIPNAVLDSLYNGILIINGEGVVTFLNSAAESIIGLNADIIIGHFVDRIIPNTGLMWILKTGVAQLNQHHTMGNCQVVANRSPIFKNNKIVGAVAVFQDVTELQAVAAELENVKNLKSALEFVIESLFEGIVVVDKKGMITMINGAYAEFLGVDSDEVVGRHVAKVIPNTRMHVVAQGGKEEITEIQQINNHNCVVTRKPLVKDGEVVGAVGKMVFKDVKDLKTLASKLDKMQFELEYYKEELRKAYGGKFTFETIIGSSEKMEWLKTVALKAAKGNASVLVLGESGVGKEVFAHFIHNASIRRSGPFIKINCAAVPENLLESELFGYDEGAFSGARKGGKPGRFELANGGTLFLDEIGDMPLTMQAKLLRVLQEKEIERVGGTKTIKLDIRLIAATNRDLDKMMEEGQFRKDLYYRLNIISLNIPPLRERAEDIPKLCSMLLQKMKDRTPHVVDKVSSEAMQIFLDYPWPGNVRELENVLERTISLMDDGEEQITPKHLPPVLKKSRRMEETEGSCANLTLIMDDAEKQAIYKALEVADGNKSKAAKLLGIHRSGFYQKLQKHNIK